MDARVLLEALEIGTDGIVLRTEDPAEVSSALLMHKKRCRLIRQPKFSC